jgi:radical SAM superfamily enzyme YgiQ (UPF0313 family)
LAQVNQRYGRNVFFPYSVGLLWAYAAKDPQIARQYELIEFLFLREPIDSVVARLRDPDVVGVSNYIWNWQYNLALARAVKERYPDCLIVMGGPQTPNRAGDFLPRHPYLDILVHQEGEAAFHAILCERLTGMCNYQQVPGITFRDSLGQSITTGTGMRMPDLENIPSPYLSGLFDSLLSLPYDFNASQETHRGCPYSCTFCDWGSAVFTKVRRFGDQRIVDEYEWMGKNRVELLYNCDANYGMLPRDVSITERLVDAKRRYGFPKKFRAAYAKKSNSNVFSIAKLLNEEKMNKGVTLSMQSMDGHTLDVVKRGNIKLTDFAETVRKYKLSQISTYTEIILGLPGETFASFCRGVDEILNAGQHDSINIYPCMLLPNSEMSDPAYVHEHGIRAVRTPMLWLHASPISGDVKEYYDVVIETSTMPERDWRRAYKLSWAIQALHCMPVLQSVAILMARIAGVSISSFYLALIQEGEREGRTLLGEQISRVDQIIDGILSGTSSDIILPMFGDIVWPLEEASFLTFSYARDRFYREARQILRSMADRNGWEVSDTVIDDALAYQWNTIVHPDDSGRVKLHLRHNVHEFVQGQHLGAPVPLRRGSYDIEIDRGAGYDGDWVVYAREAVWYGRKGGSLRHAALVSTELEAA